MDNFKLTTEQINNNKESFLDLVRGITREFDKEKLINWLEKSDFFTAPASIKNQSSFDGGLCFHSLNVYASLENLCANFAIDENGNALYSEDSIRIVALFHDLSKANYYEKFNRNVKNEITGKWEQKEDYRIRELSNRFIYGNREETSLYMVKSFIPNMTVEEEVAILNVLGGVGYDSAQTNLVDVYDKYGLACLLHVADTLSTFILKS